MTTSVALMAAALAHANRGWHVFPLRPGEKRPALHAERFCPATGSCAGGHRGWEQRATTDPTRVRAAWSTGAFNIGLATGPSGLVVVDLDAAKDGETPPPEWDLPGVRDGQDVFAVLAERAADPLAAATFTVTTPSGGLHLYYAAPRGVELRNTAGTQLGWRVDTRAHGGYVVAAGSMVDGQPYTVVNPQPPAPLPAWLADLLTPTPPPTAPARPVTAGSRRSRYLDAAVRMECQKVETAAKGQRNGTLYAAALALGQLVAGGSLPRDEVEAVLLTAAGRHIAVGAFNQRQALATIRSGIERGANRPRQVA